MKVRTVWGLVFIAVLALNGAAWSQTVIDEPSQPLVAPKVSISNEQFFLEREGNVLLLCWQGYITLVKPTEQPIAITAYSSFDPPGQWSSRQRTLAVATNLVVGVNSFFQKIELGQIILTSTGKDNLPALKTLLTKDQVFSLRIKLTSLGRQTGGMLLAEETFRMNPLGYALVKASESGDRREVEDLLRRDVNVNSSTIEGWTPLMAACAGGHSAVVKLLLDRQANVAAETKGIRMILSPNGSSSPRGNTPLLAAAYAGRPDIVRMLIDAGATYGDTIRRLRKIGASDDDIVRLILEKGAGYQEVVNRLVGKGASRKDILALNERGDFADIVWRLTKRGATLAGTFDRFQKTDLSTAAVAAKLRNAGATQEEIDRLSRTKVITKEDLRKSLLNKGATEEDINRLTKEKDTDEQQVRQCLSNKGATGPEIDRLIRDRDSAGEEIRRFLREKGATEDEIESCLLDRGVAPSEVVEFLVKHGGSIDAQRADNWTPITAAAFAGNPELVRLLLSESANPNIIDENGYSPAAIARINGNTRAYRLLTKCGGRTTVPWGSPLDHKD